MVCTYTMCFQDLLSLGLLGISYPNVVSSCRVSLHSMRLIHKSMFNIQRRCVLVLFHGDSSRSSLILPSKKPLSALRPSRFPVAFHQNQYLLTSGHVFALLLSLPAFLSCFWFRNPSKCRDLGSVADALVLRDFYPLVPQQSYHRKGEIYDIIPGPACI